MYRKCSGDFLNLSRGKIMAIKPCFYYKNGKLMVEEIEVEKIIKEVGTPTYIYSQKKFQEQFHQLTSSFKNVSTIICFSLKVCHNLNIIRLFTTWGCGLDIVSGGELFRALKAGADPQKIVYSGVAKTVKEIREAIEAGILLFNVESEQELVRINEIAEQLHKKVSIAIRVNPDIDAKTHPYITTGMKENKFGIDSEKVFSIYHKANQMRNVVPIGIDCHIGSQLLDLTPFGEATKKIARIVEKLRSEGIYITYVDVGGGLGIPYKDEEKPISCEEYARLITEPFEKIPDITFILEPGRFLAGSAGILITRVQYIKENSYKKRFVIVDTGMHHLLRPPLYGAHHKIIPIKETLGEKKKVDVVGPICESTDFLAKNYYLEEVRQDDLLAIIDCGAYCIVLASHYNSHFLPVEVLVNGNQFRIIRTKETYENMIANDV